MKKSDAARGIYSDQDVVKDQKREQDTQPQANTKNTEPIFQKLCVLY